MVTDRGLEVLRAIVHDYVSTREPVGSQTIVHKHQLGVSAATIRNDMAQLEEEELITAPHTSSGRIPTDKGYRVFVDHLATLRPLNKPQRDGIDEFLRSAADTDELLTRSVRLLAQLTNQLALVQYPSLGNTRLRHLELISVAPARVLCVLITDNGRVEQRVADLPRDVSTEDLRALTSHLNSELSGELLSGMQSQFVDVAKLVPAQLQDVLAVITQSIFLAVDANRHQRLVVAGAKNLIRTEDDFSGHLYDVLDAIEEQVTVIKLLSELAQDERQFAISIGHEHSQSGLQDASLVASRYTVDGDTSALGVIGPTRMNYGENIASVRAIARYLSKSFDSSFSEDS